ncbi:MAG: hypothetical protein AAGH88_11845 [Planctomycetota bacterium]
MAQPVEKVILIHGIAMRSEAKVERYAEALNAQLGEGIQLVPIYWGDLGGDDTYLHKVISRYPDKSANFGRMMQDAIARPLVRGTHQARAWIEQKRGELSRSMAREQMSRKFSRDARQRVRGYMGDKFQDVRLWLTQQSLPFIADVIVYQSHTYRPRIHARVREVIDRELGEDAGRPGKPVKVIGHSLGGVVAFDMAVRSEDPLHIESFVTLGSQPAFFHLLDPREGVEPFEGEPVTLPATVGNWTNISDAYDVLAFSTREVFVLHEGHSPEDLTVRCTRSRIKGGVFLRSHLGYFDNADTGTHVRRALEEGRA